MDLHVTHFKPIAVLNKTVSSKRVILGEGSGDAFWPYRSKTNLFESTYNPLEADCSSEQNGFIQNGVLSKFEVS